MSKFPWRAVPAGASLNEDKGGPWGSSGRGGNGGGGGGGNGGGNGGEGPRNPWSQPPRKRPVGVGGNVTSLDDFLKKSRDRFGGQMPSMGGRPILLYIGAALIAAWFLFTAVHRIGPQERGVVTWFGGQYSGTLTPGMQFTFPAPIQKVEKIDVEGIRTIDIGGGTGTAEKLMLTGDQNIIDLAYSVRWNISDPELYMFQLSDPDATIGEVAESAMRAVVSQVSLDDAIGAERSQIEQDVQARMQDILTRYRAGVAIQGIAIRQADPPAAVNQAFKAVSAAQQEAQSYMNQARAYALQLTAKAQGEAAQFDKIYEQYRLAPEVTRRRMYYETMEQVLSKVDKTIVETGNVTPYLALPEVARRGPIANTTETATTGAAQ